MLPQNGCKQEERNPCTFCLSRAAEARGRGIVLTQRRTPIMHSRTGDVSHFSAPSPQARLELPSLHHVSPSASVLAPRAPPLTRTSSALLQAYQKMFSLEEKQMRNRGKKRSYFPKKTKKCEAHPACLA